MISPVPVIWPVITSPNQFWLPLFTFYSLFSSHFDHVISHLFLNRFASTRAQFEGLSTPFLTMLTVLWVSLSFICYSMLSEWMSIFGGPLWPRSYLIHSSVVWMQFDSSSTTMCDKSSRSLKTSHDQSWPVMHQFHIFCISTELWLELLSSQCNWNQRSSHYQSWSSPVPVIFQSQ